MRVFRFIDSLLAGPAVEDQAQVVGYGSREHPGELDVRPFPHALSPRDVVGKREVWRERLVIPALLVMLGQRKISHSDGPKEHVQTKKNAMPMPQTIHPTSLPFALANVSNTNAALRGTKRVDSRAAASTASRRRGIARTPSTRP